MYFPIAVFCAAALSSGQSYAAGITFEGKQIKFLIGFSAATFGYDTYGRLLSKYLGKYLPGNPVVVPQNRPGAGSLALMNQLYNAEPKDGTSIALVGRGAAMEPLLGSGESQARFEATRFNWIGSMNNEVAGFFVTDKSPATTLKQVLAGTEIQVGSTGAGGDPQIFARALNATLHTKLKIVGGYPGIQEVILALQRGELDGLLGYSWAVARLGSAEDLKSGRLKMIMQLGLNKHPDLPDVPLVTDLVPEGEGRETLRLIFARQTMGRPVVAPPDLPPGMTDLLRDAFEKTLKDPEFVQTAEKMGLEINYVSGKDVQDIIGKIYAAPEGVLEQVRQAVK
jgi:tripartite-type tricarboxylate transporter receptor subunit TctC